MTAARGILNFENIFKSKCQIFKLINIINYLDQMINFQLWTSELCKWCQRGVLGTKLIIPSQKLLHYALTFNRPYCYVKLDSNQF